GHLTRQYRPLLALNAQIAALKKTLPIPFPTRSKEDAWVPMTTLREVGHALWPKKHPSETRRTGARLAVYAGLSLMLQLWTYRPYRQRNMREMLLGKNLYKDTDGKWCITFRGEQMKVALKRGKPNVFSLSFPTALVPVLEDYLQIWRPVLVAKSPHPEKEHHVFLNIHGTPFAIHAIHGLASRQVYRYTGKPWHPHMIRTTWATEWISQGGDFLTAAKMLNDRLETVIANYAHLREGDVTEKADRFIDALV